MKKLLVGVLLFSLLIGCDRPSNQPQDQPGDTQSQETVIANDLWGYRKALAEILRANKQSFNLSFYSSVSQHSDFGKDDDLDVLLEVDDARYYVQFDANFPQTDGLAPGLNREKIMEVLEVLDDDPLQWDIIEEFITAAGDKYRSELFDGEALVDKMIIYGDNLYMSLYINKDHSGSLVVVRSLKKDKSAASCFTELESVLDKNWGTDRKTDYSYGELISANNPATWEIEILLESKKPRYSDFCLCDFYFTVIQSETIADKQQKYEALDTKLFSELVNYWAQAQGMKGRLSEDMLQEFLVDKAGKYPSHSDKTKGILEIKNRKNIPGMTGVLEYCLDDELLEYLNFSTFPDGGWESK